MFVYKDLDTIVTRLAGVIVYKDFNFLELFLGNLRVVFQDAVRRFRKHRYRLRVFCLFLIVGSSAKRVYSAVFLSFNVVDLEVERGYYFGLPYLSRA